MKRCKPMVKVKAKKKPSKKNKKTSTITWPEKDRPQRIPDYSMGAGGDWW